MGLGWNETDELAEKHEDTGGLFIRLKKDGDKIIGAFVGAPYSREMHWTGDKYAKCIGDGCPYCQDKKPFLRVSMNFFVPAENQLKIIEGGTLWYKDLVKVRQKYGLDNWLFEVERHGEGTKTSYSIYPDKEISAALHEQIAGAQQHDLFEVTSGNKKQSDSTPAAQTTTSSSQQAATIDGGIVRAYIDRLKTLPREAVDEFLAQLKVTKIKDVPRESVPEANAYIDMLEARYRQPQATNQQEADPFEV